MKHSNIKSLFLLTILTMVVGIIIAQQYDCTFKAPIFKIDFGNALSTSALHLTEPENYDEDGGTCPQDGYYSIIPQTSGCFMGNWITLSEDHTPGDNAGKMMVVNAAMDPGTFFSYPIPNITAGTTYELSVWIINILDRKSVV